MKVTKTELPQRLEEVEDRFVDLWDTMSSLWGISPTMARIHGLLYISGAALSMDDIMDRLGISRGNVSMNLSKLVQWGLVRRVHKRRNRRDIDPILNTLRRCRAELSPETLGGHAEEPAAEERRHRINDLLSFLTLV